VNSGSWRAIDAALFLTEIFDTLFRGLFTVGKGVLICC